MNCPLKPDECPYAYKDFSKGVVPRGFKYKSDVKPDLMIIGKNPGHPIKNEVKYCIGKVGKELFNAWLKWTKDRRRWILSGSDKPDIFSTNRQRYLLYILGFHNTLKSYQRYKYSFSDADKVLKKAFFTNLFKCSTRNERSAIPDKAFTVCYEKYFIREINILKPKVILCVGGEVYRFLKRKIRSNELNIPIIPIKHFSYFYKKEKEKRELAKIRKLYQLYLRKKAI